MKKSKLKLLALFFVFFIFAVTPSCEAFWQAMQESSSQVDEDDETKNDETSTSKGKGQSGGN